jgi:hypothetical protein
MESFCTTGLATTRRVGGKGVALENLGWLVAACVGGAAARAPQEVGVVVGDAWRQWSIGAGTQGRRR